MDKNHRLNSFRIALFHRLLQLTWLTWQPLSYPSSFVRSLVRFFLASGDAQQVARDFTDLIWLRPFIERPDHLSQNIGAHLIENYAEAPHCRQARPNKPLVCGAPGGASPVASGALSSTTSCFLF